MDGMMKETNDMSDMDRDTDDLKGNGTIAEPNDGLPGVAVDGYPGLRAGASASGNGLLGIWRPTGSGAADCSDPRVMLAANRTGSPEALPKGYQYDANGNLQLTPDFARTHPGAFDFGGMGHNIDWAGVAKDLGKLGLGTAMGVAGAALGPVGIGVEGRGALPNPYFTGGSLVWKGGKTLYNQDKINRDGGPAVKATDRATSGRP
jgi:hypothetical protein